MKDNIKNHPLTLSQTEYDELPDGKDMGEDDWKYVPMGHRFKSKEDPLIVIEVCKGMDMYVDQWGAGTSVPERGLRWYMAVIEEAA